MSSRRYQEDIRRIVGLQDAQGGLDDALPRMRIEGQRGIFLIGASETQSGASPGETEDGEATDPIMPDENDDNQNEDGSGTGGPGTDPSETDPDDFEIDPDDTGNYSPDDSTFGGSWASGGATSFVDCESGKCIEVVERGGYVPPEGWDSANDPPVDEFYEKGYYWENFTGFYINVRVIGLSPAQVYAGLPQSTTNTTGRIRTKNRLATGNPTSAGAVYCVDGFFCGGDQVEIIIIRKACPPDGSVSICDNDVPPPRPEYWPPDNCIQLTPNSEGNWQASNRENPNDMSAKYSEPKSTLDLCTPNGDGVQVLPGADGGYVYWNYTKGIFRAVSPDGRQSFGGATEVTTAVAGSAAGGGSIKPQGAPVPGA